MLDVQTIDMTPDRENPQMELIAKMAAVTLNKHYPNHLWMIGWAPGAVLVIKNGGADSRYGFTIDIAKSHSVNHLEHWIMVAGGELLERMGHRRGAWDGEFRMRYEGMLPGHGPLPV